MKSVSHANSKTRGNVLILVMVLLTLLMFTSIGGLQRLQQQALLVDALEQHLHLRDAAYQLLNVAVQTLTDNPAMVGPSPLPTLAGNNTTPKTRGRWYAEPLATPTTLALSRYVTVSVQAQSRTHHELALQALYRQGRHRGITTIVRRHD